MPWLCAGDIFIFVSAGSIDNSDNLNTGTPHFASLLRPIPLQLLNFIVYLI